MKQHVSLLATFLLSSVCNAQKVIEITGPGWKLQDSNRSISVNAHTPSDQYVDLYNDGVIGNPIYGSNDTAEQWVQLSNWTYISPSLHQLQLGGYGSGKQSTWLVFEGLDTFAEVSMCGEELFNANNQFRQWLHDVTDVLPKCKGEPKLMINFGSPVNITHQISNSSAGDRKSIEPGIVCASVVTT